jgi:hypothetical protein
LNSSMSPARPQSTGLANTCSGKADIAGPGDGCGVVFSPCVELRSS